ncbi:hypothetical protein N8946_04370 [Pseudomonadales bacterium]|nr:hypothetical protein [Pseudomonadales bacterium]
MLFAPHTCKFIRNGDFISYNPRIMTRRQSAGTARLTAANMAEIESSALISPEEWATLIS